VKKKGEKERKEREKERSEQKIRRDPSHLLIFTTTYITFNNI